ncbi:Similar to EDEM2: ER degradation-enhancing alpha-mannosidase-like protein 2 (Homo sapiens) [Cotesia congregata]|uniref:alpha-1,2-Mannosidase n=1 Tax=Cotesia congregata TaxID=51543 RepID=A0A8J2GZL6_COTCN|nr:Similar to EDEM2: ER degradation-enhancing alpha-mannosidase-like protein 2 (Homo sapiens) [Cotesia congregata]
MLFPRILILLTSVSLIECKRKYQKEDLASLKEEVRSMFDYAYSSYLNYAYPYDELRSLSCDGYDTWGSFSLTLIDALDTLAVIGNFSEFRRIANIISTRNNFEANINVSVFETNIRVVGGLLSAHLLIKKAGMTLPPGWPCNGPLLRLAEDMAKRLIVAFDTPTGMPYGTVNLKYGVPSGETTITCTAGIGTFLLEFSTLSRLTGDPLYEEVAMNAVKALRYYRSKIGLVGNHIDILTGQWTARDSGIGAGVDSYFEYLAKGTLLLQNPVLAEIFHDYRAAIEKYIRREDWHLWVSMTEGHVTLPVFQSLDAYWPGVLSLFGETNDAMKSIHNYHQVWKQFGFTPEFYNIAQAEAGTNRESYPLRPELIESVMYLYRATKDPYLIQVGVDILKSLQHSARTKCGYATINDVRDHKKSDRMESFFLAETTKYLYLLFDPDNFIHANGQTGEIVKTQWTECVVGAGGYIFNTEAHPIDPGALACCKPFKSFFSKKSNLEKLTDYRAKVKEVKLKNVTSEDSLEGIYKNENFNKSNNNKKESKNFSSFGKAVVTNVNIVSGDGNGENSKIQSEDYNSKISLDEDLKKNDFIAQSLLERIRSNNMYSVNSTYGEDYQFLSCQAQPFLQRISIIGEFF